MIDSNKRFSETDYNELRVYLCSIIKNMAFDSGDKGFEDSEYFNSFTDRITWLLKNKNNLSCRPVGSIQNIADRYTSGEFGKSKLTINNFLGWISQTTGFLQVQNKEIEGSMKSEFLGIFKCWENLKNDVGADEVKNKYPNLWNQFEGKSTTFDIEKFRNRQYNKEQDLL